VPEQLEQIRAQERLAAADREEHTARRAQLRNHVHGFERGQLARFVLPLMVIV